MSSKSKTTQKPGKLELDFTLKKILSDGGFLTGLRKLCSYPMPIFHSMALAEFAAEVDKELAAFGRAREAAAKKASIDAEYAKVAPAELERALEKSVRLILPGKIDLIAPPADENQNAVQSDIPKFSAFEILAIKPLVNLPSAP